MQYQNNLTGNDRWIVEHIFPSQRGRFFVEAGACNGIKASSCYVLEKYLDWRGIAIEPNDDYFQELVVNRPNSICESRCLSAKSGSVTYISGTENLINPMRGGIKDNLIQYKQNHQEILDKGQAITKEAVSLSDLLVEHDAPQVIDYLAMDIEGSELPVLSVFPFEKYLILAISIEGYSCNDLLTEKGYLNIKNPFNTEELYEQFFIHPSIFKENYHQLTGDRYLSLGNNFARKEKTDLAIAAYQQAIALEPDNTRFYNHVGSYLQQQQDLAGAIANYSQAIAIDSKQPVWVYYSLGNLLQQQGKLPEALAAYQQAIEIEPTLPFWVYSNLGNLFRQQGKLPEALAAYQKAIEIDSKVPAWVYSSLGNVCQQQGKLPEALAAYQKAIEIESQPPAWMYYSAGNILQQQGKFSEALATYQKAIAIDPEVPNWVEKAINELTEVTQIAKN